MSIFYENEQNGLKWCNECRYLISKLHGCKCKKED